MYQLNTKNQYKNKKENKIFNFTKKIILILSIIFFIMILIVFTGTGNNPVEYQTITVESGQTLWCIAQDKITREQNIRKYIYNIRQLNDLDDVILQPGQKLKIPEY